MSGMSVVVVLVGTVLVAIVGVGAVYVLGMRAKSRVVIGPLVRLQRAVINPRQLRSAGSPGSYASIIRHIGRSSGRPYETPVGVVATEDGFLIGLVYGTGTNWVRNVLASGRATIIHEGRTYSVDRPEVLPMRTVAAHFAPSDRRGFRFLGVDQALRVHNVVPADAAMARPRASQAAPERGWEARPTG
jgi:deazaflavin-dependent oxidoreductase (nitroreductase family)